MILNYDFKSFIHATITLISGENSVRVALR